MSDYAVENLARVVEDLRARADNYREEREAARDMADVERKRTDAALSRVKELEGALEKYGEHAHGCPADRASSYGGVELDRGVCDCGLDAAVEGNSKLPTNSASRVAAREAQAEPFPSSVVLAKNDGGTCAECGHPPGGHFNGCSGFLRAAAKLMPKGTP